jgi:hypothetical protein
MSAKLAVSAHDAVIGYNDPVVSEVPVPPGAQEALKAQLLVIGYNDPVVRVVPPLTAF